MTTTPYSTAAMANPLTLRTRNSASAKKALIAKTAFDRLARSKPNKFNLTTCKTKNLGKDERRAKSPLKRQMTSRKASDFSRRKWNNSIVIKICRKRANRRRSKKSKILLPSLLRCFFQFRKSLIRGFM